MSASKSRRVQQLVSRFEAPSDAGGASAESQPRDKLQKPLPRSGASIGLGDGVRPNGLFNGSGPAVTPDHDSLLGKHEAQSLKLPAQGEAAPRVEEGAAKAAGNGTAVTRSKNDHILPSQANGSRPADGSAGRNHTASPGPNSQHQGSEGSSQRNGSSGSHGSTSSGSGRSSSSGQGVESGVSSNCSSWERCPIAPHSDSDLDSVIGLTSGSLGSSGTGRSSAADPFDAQQGTGASDGGAGSGSSKGKHAASAQGAVDAASGSKNSMKGMGLRLAGGEGSVEDVKVSQAGKQAAGRSGRGSDEDARVPSTGGRGRGVTHLEPADEASRLAKGLHSVSLGDTATVGQGSRRTPGGVKEEDPEAASPMKPRRSQKKRSRSPRAEPSFADWTNVGASAEGGMARYAEAVVMGASGPVRSRFGDNQGEEGRALHGWDHWADPSAGERGARGERGAFMAHPGAHEDHTLKQEAGVGYFPGPQGGYPAPRQGLYGPPGMPSSMPPGRGIPVGPLGVAQSAVPGASQHTAHGVPRVHSSGEQEGSWLPIPREHSVGHVYEFRAARSAPVLQAQPPWAGKGAGTADVHRAQVQPPWAGMGASTADAHWAQAQVPHPQALGSSPISPRLGGAGEGPKAYAMGAPTSSRELGAVAHPGQGQGAGSPLEKPSLWSAAHHAPQFTFGAPPGPSNGGAAAPRSRARQRGHRSAAGGMQAEPHWASRGEARGDPGQRSQAWSPVEEQELFLRRQQAQVEGGGMQRGGGEEGEGEGVLPALKEQAGRVVAGWVQSMKANGGLVVAAAAGVLFAGALLSMAVGGRGAKGACKGDACERKPKATSQGAGKPTGKGSAPSAPSQAGAPPSARGQPRGPKMVLHKVARGETICSIAGCYGADPDEVVDLNVVNAQTRKARDPDVIYPGEIIVVPSTLQTPAPLRRR